MRTCSLLSMIRQKSGVLASTADVGASVDDALAPAIGAIARSARGRMARSIARCCPKSRLEQGSQWPAPAALSFHHRQLLIPATESTSLARVGESLMAGERRYGRAPASRVSGGEEPFVETLAARYRGA